MRQMLTIVFLGALSPGLGCTSAVERPSFDGGADADAAQNTDVDAAQDSDVGADHDADQDNEVETGCTDPEGEVCDGQDNDCDGEIDEDFDLQTDESNCGECNNRCPRVENGWTRCLDGDCVPFCDVGFENCDENGLSCEVDIRRVDNCGSCGNECSPSSLCQEDPIDPGSYHCTALCPTLCEGSCVDHMNDVDHCLECFRSCRELDGDFSFGVCREGVCELECWADYADCNEDLSDGCESYLGSTETCGDCETECLHERDLCQMAEDGTFVCGTICTEVTYPCPDGTCANLMDDPNHCGTCDGVCDFGERSEALCIDGVCDLACTTPEYGDCNDDFADGCEEELVLYHNDLDDDGFGSDTSGELLCADEVDSDLHVLIAGDCDDDDAAINPSASEVCLNGVDDNCDGSIDEGC